MNRQNHRKYVEIVLAIVVIIVSGILLNSVWEKNSYRHSEKCESISTGWYYVDGGNKIYISVPGKLAVGEQKGLTLYNDEISDEYSGKVITLRGAKYDLEIKAGNQLLYDYTEEGFERNEQMRSKIHCDARLPENLKENQVALVFYSAGDSQYEIPRIYIGTEKAVLGSHIREDLFNIGVVLAIVVLSILAIAISVCMRRIKMGDKRFEDIGGFLLLCGLWCMTDSSIAQTMSNMSPMMCYISFYAFMLFGIPMLHFLKNTGDMNKYRILDVCILSFYINVIAQSILCYLGIFRFIDMLFITHILLVGSVVIGALLLVKEYRENPKKELLLIIFSFCVVSAGGVLAILLYWLYEVPYYGMIYETGIVVFVVLILCGVIASNVGNMKFKTEMEVYQRLSKEDRLTGMLNRRAFEEELEEIESNIYSYEDAVLIFLDINRLKEMNDYFGHSAGDELIIIAAKCIKNAFAEIGMCYRIGGDEFCVILPETHESEAKLMDRLDEEIAKQNKDSRFHLSIARGLSFLKDCSGTVKSVSDWKYEADHKMYENKGWHRINQREEE